MDQHINTEWPEVTEEELHAVLKTLDYYHFAWSNVINYHERGTDRVFAQEVGGTKWNPTVRYLLHPGLKANL